MELNVIPAPVIAESKPGSLKIGPEIEIIARKKYQFMVDTIVSAFDSLLGRNCCSLRYLESETNDTTTQNNRGKVPIILREEMGVTKSQNHEGYVLEINDSSILIRGETEPGIFYAIQTLIQLLPMPREEPQEEIEIPCIKIVDYPRFPWRGFMLDVGRHFFPSEEVKRLLDTMAMLKMNRFHWHLTEDQGWRIEIERYPKLVEIGSIRKDTQIGGILSKKREGKPHSGYYTQEEIRDIVEYAKRRFIEVIPEIDIPGHSTAALAAYPEYSCREIPIEVETTFGIKKDVFCVGKEKTFEFLFNIIDEIIKLFPSKIFHLGGDEVPKDRWKECPACQARIKELGLKGEEDLQVYFTNRIAEYLKNKGWRIMGWNEILGAGVDPSAIVQYWARSEEPTIQHLRNGGNAVFSKFGHIYLDYNYGLTPLKKSYEYEPIPERLEEDFRKNVLGIETPMWTEWARNKSRLHWQIFPRLLAVAETGWTPKHLKNYARFRKSCEKLYPRLKKLGIQPADLSIVDPKGLKRWILLLKSIHEPFVPEK